MVHLKTLNVTAEIKGFTTSSSYLERRKKEDISFDSLFNVYYFQHFTF